MKARGERHSEKPNDFCKCSHFQWDEWKLNGSRDYPSPAALPPASFSGSPSWDADMAAAEVSCTSNKALRCGKQCRRDTLTDFSSDMRVGRSGQFWLLWFFFLLLFLSWGVLVGLTQVWCHITIKLLNLSIPLVSRCVFLYLTFNVYACISALIMSYYLTCNSVTPCIFIGGTCNLTRKVTSHVG